MPSTDNFAAPGHIMFHLLLALGLGAAVKFAYFSGDWIFSGFVIFVIVMMYFGYWSGMIKIVSSIIGLLAGIGFAQTFSPTIAKYFDQYFHFAESYRELISLVVAGILVAITTRVLFRVIAYSVLQWIPYWERVDRGIGAVLGGLQGLILSMIFLVGAMILEPIAEQHVTQYGERQSTGFVDQWPEQVIAFMRHTRRSSIGTVMVAMQPICNLFNHRFNEMQDVIVTNSETINPIHQKMMQMLRKFGGDS